MEAGSDFVQELQDAMLRKFELIQRKLIESYHRYHSYYDHKATAKPLVLHHFCMLLNPKLPTQKAGTPKSWQTWIPLYRVKKVLTHSNYIVRKVGTNFTQCVHRLRLRPVSPHSSPEDLTDVDPSNFTPDPCRRSTGMEPEVFDEHFPALFIEDPVSVPPRPASPPPATVSLSVRAPPAGAPVPLLSSSVDPPFEAPGSSTSSSQSSSPQMSSDENDSSSAGAAPPRSSMTLRLRLVESQSRRRTLAI